MSQPLAGDRGPMAQRVSLARIQAVAQGDQDFVREMVEEFSNDTRTAITGFRTSVTNADASSARKFAHSLKGLAATVDAHQLVELASRAENAALAGDLAALAPLSSPMAEELRLVAEELQGILGETA